MEGLEVEDLKGEKCARISGADVVELVARRKSRSGHGKIVVIDVRPREQYIRGTISSAINIPADSLLNHTHENIQDAPAFKTIAPFKGKIIAVMGSKMNHAQVIKVSFFLIFFLLCDIFCFK